MDSKFSVYGHALDVVKDLSGSVQEIGGVDRYEPSTSSRTVGFGTKLSGMLHGVASSKS